MEHGCTPAFFRSLRFPVHVNDLRVYVSVCLLFSPCLVHVLLTLFQLFLIFFCWGLFEDINRHWGGGVLGSKSAARVAKIEK